MAEFGDTDPLLEHNDKDDDEDVGNTTKPSQPDNYSTPRLSGEEIPIMETMDMGEEKG